MTNKKQKVFVKVPAGYYVSVTEAAKILKITRTAVNMAITGKRLMAYTIGGLNIINIADLNAYSAKMNRYGSAS